MDFQREIEKLSPKVQRLIALLNDPSVDPALRKKAMAAVLNGISSNINSKVYEMSAFDFQISETSAPAIDTRYGDGLAGKVSDSIASGGFDTEKDRVGLFVAMAVTTAVAAASVTARDLGQYTTLQRFTRNGGDCEWCIGQAARGVIRNPQPIDFGRHKGCDCLLESKGFGSRNGEVKNYRPK